MRLYWCYCWRQWMPACSQWVHLYLIPCLQWRRGMPSSHIHHNEIWCLPVSVCSCSTGLHLFHNPLLILARTAQKCKYVKKYNIFFLYTSTFLHPGFYKMFASLSSFSTSLKGFFHLQRQKNRFLLWKVLAQLGNDVNFSMQCKIMYETKDGENADV